MKKILLFAAALLAFAGCEDKPLDPPVDVIEDTISVDPKSVSFENAGGNAEVVVTSSGDWTVSSEKDYSWVVPSAKSGKNGAVVKFAVSKNETTEELQAVYTFTSGEATATFTITVAAGDAPEPPAPEEPYFKIEKTNYEVNENASTVEIEVNTNVEYTFTIGQPQWITHKETKGKVEVFNVAALPEGETKRDGQILFQGNNDGVILHIIQTRSGGVTPDPTPGDALITTAGKFSSTRVYPTWEGNAAPFYDMSEFTFEALVYHENGWNSLNTIMGIDGYFMIRTGDDGIQKNELQIATSPDNDGAEIKLNSGVLLDENRWYHIAVSFNKGEIKLYVDGEEKATKTAEGTTKRTFNRPHTDEPGGWGATRCFWIGYACGSDRCWKGMMSEVRIWNKALTASDLKAANHFYTVDAKSSGLVSYWKFNEGEGDVVKDHTSNGNDLKCQININGASGSNTITATDGMEWATVSLPE
ncbi:MAG: hypothetical protein NC115_11150 [Bacteroidales bacterium]|nr:hypothetical protein [Bacteroidales bacterium]